MFPHPPGVLTNPPMNLVPQQPLRPPQPSFQRWFPNAAGPAHDIDERQNFFRVSEEEEEEEVKNFDDTKEDFRYYPTLPYEADMKPCRQDSWNDNMDAPRQNPMNTDRLGEMNEKQPPHYQCIDYGHGKSSPAMYNKPADRVSPEKSNSRPSGESFSTDNYNTNDEELFQLFEDGLDLMIRTSKDIRVVLESNPRLKWFLLPIFKDLDQETVIQIFGQGNENVAAKKLEKMVCLTKSKIQELCSEIAETISIRQSEEAKQKDEDFAKPAALLNNSEFPMNLEDGPSGFGQESITAFSNDPDRGASMPQGMHQHKDVFEPTSFPYDSSLDIAKMSHSNSNDFPFPLRPCPPAIIGPVSPPHLMLPPPRFSHLTNRLPLPPAAPFLRSPMLLRPNIPPFLNAMWPPPPPLIPPTRDSRNLPPKMTTTPAAKKVKNPPCLQSIPLLSEENAKAKHILNTSEKKDINLLLSHKESKPLLMKSKTPDKMENMAPKEKLVYLIKCLKSLKKPVCKISFFDSLPQRIACPSLKLQYHVLEQNKFFFGTFTINGVFITRQKAENKKKLKKIVFERAYDMLQSYSADAIIYNGDPNTTSEKVLKEEKFELIAHIESIQKFIAVHNSKGNITLQQMNQSVAKKLPFHFVNRKIGKPGTHTYMVKIMLNDCKIAVALASSDKAAKEKASALAVQRLKTLPTKEIAYEKGLDKLNETTVENKSLNKQKLSLEQKLEKLKGLLKSQKPFPTRIMKHDFLNKTAAANGIPHSVVYQKIGQTGMKILCSLFLGKICVAYGRGATAKIARFEAYDTAWSLLCLKPYAYFTIRARRGKEKNNFALHQHLLKEGGVGADERSLSAQFENLKDAGAPADKQ